jgi:hypothetical protein
LIITIAIVEFAVVLFELTETGVLIQ